MAPKNPGNFPRAIPDSAGIPKSVQDEMLIGAFNDIEMAESLIKEHRDELAGVIVEPFQRLIPPAPGFLQGLRDIATQYGIPLIFDEVVTGFRFAYGGAQTYYGVTPDLTSLAKILAGGLPGGCLAGRADVLAAIEPRPGKPKMKHPGTFNANPLSAAAGVAAA